MLGLNGAGKSTLLRIMAGIVQDYIGKISQAKGYTCGLLEQEPKLNETKTVIEVVKEAVQPIVEMLARFDEVNAKFADPDVLLLDEPTNHLDAESVAWLEHHLREYKGTVIAVTHDRDFLDNVAGWILELEPRLRHPLQRQLLILSIVG